MFLGRETPPTEDEQFKVYKSTVVAMKGRPVTIRTLDIGADKPLDSQNIILSTQYNPALGLRAIRYCLSEPEMFAIQLRALLRASAFGPIKILIPMLAHVSEIEQTLAMIEQAKLELRGSKIKFDPLTPIGAMIEIPAAALSLPAFIKRLDFLSIGTNDLIQYTLAIDRVDHEVAHLYDPLHPAVLQLLSLIISTANKANKPVSVCGEMAGDIQFTRLLMGMGLRNFSMHPTQLLAVKYQILNSNYTSLVPVIKKLLRTTEPTKVQALMQQLQIV